MNVLSAVAGAAQIGAVMTGAPLVVGLMRQVRARSEGVAVQVFAALAGSA
ncbi:formate hydrogenlyase HycD domain protein [Mycobacterium kansasii]|uniref:Formate hydrogenlyase HycD domain protein n=1 Tax=Mycobacterium kansasii TaxID=1768 RepID=A0A1V3XSZ0_MYCKA|nr:formate hydrogenlyase HycD domain protein [Mycobacterium kansasii]